VCGRTERQTNGRTDVTKLILASRNLAKVSKNDNEPAFSGTLYSSRMNAYYSILCDSCDLVDIVREKYELKSVCLASPNIFFLFSPRGRTPTVIFQILRNLYILNSLRVTKATAGSLSITTGESDLVKSNADKTRN
jgi:hypothetical protein